MEIPGEVSGRPGPLDRRDWLIMAACLALALGARLFYWIRFDPPMSGDFQHYYYLASSLLQGDLRHFVHYHYPPLYPLTLAPLAAIFENPETAARLAGLIAGSITVAPIYLLGRAVFGRGAAAAGSVFFAFKYLQLSVQGGAEPLLVLLTLTGALLGLRALAQPDGRRVAGAAAIFGLATLAKLEGLAFFGLWFLWLVGRLWLVRPRPRAAGLAVLAVGMFYLPQAPYLGAFYADTGHLAINPKLATLFYIHNEPDWSEGSYGLRQDAGGSYTVFQRAIAEGDRRQDRSLLDYLRRNVSRLPGLYADRLGFIGRTIVPAMLWILAPGVGWPVAILLILALAGWWRDWMQARRELYLWSFALLPFVLVPLFAPEMRFFAVTLAVLALALGRGVERGAHVYCSVPTRKGPPRIRLKWALVVAVVLVLWPDLDLLRQAPVKNDYRKLVEDRVAPAAFIGDNLEPGRRIMSMWLTAPFWHLAGIAPERDLGIPSAPLDDLVRYARQQDVQFIVAGEADAAARYPELRPLFAPGGGHPGLRLVYSAAGPNGGRYLIFMVMPKG